MGGYDFDERTDALTDYSSDSQTKTNSSLRVRVWKDDDLSTKVEVLWNVDAFYEGWGWTRESTGYCRGTFKLSRTDGHGLVASGSASADIAGGSATSSVIWTIHESATYEALISRGRFDGGHWANFAKQSQTSSVDTSVSRISFSVTVDPNAPAPAAPDAGLPEETGRACPEGPFDIENRATWWWRYASPKDYPQQIIDIIATESRARGGTASAPDHLRPDYFWALVLPGHAYEQVCASNMDGETLYYDPDTGTAIYREQLDPDAVYRWAVDHHLVKDQRGPE
ncbi:hypothetical protein [Streptomyces sp. NPDC003952]